MKSSQLILINSTEQIIAASVWSWLTENVDISPFAIFELCSFSMFDVDSKYEGAAFRKVLALDLIV